MNKIRLALVLEATEGGTWTHLNLLTTKLHRDRFDVTVICSTLRDPSIGPKLQEWREMGFPVHVTRMKRSINVIGDTLSFWHIYRLMLREHFDVVHTHSSKAGFLGRMAAKCAGVPVVVHTPHVFAFQQTLNPIVRRFYLTLERFAARVTTAIVCVCEAERTEALRQRIISPDRLLVLPNAVSLPNDAMLSEAATLRNQLGIPSASPVVGTVANFRKQKALHDFIEAARIVCQSHPKAVFLMIGSGMLGSELKAHLLEAGIHGNFRMISAPWPIWSYYACMDVFALTSQWEALPYALLEAMAMAKPVVVTAVGGCREVVDHGQTGLLVPSGQPQTIAQAMCLLLENQVLRRKLGTAAQNVIRKQYKVEERICELEAIYQCALQKSSLPSSPALVHS